LKIEFQGSRMTSDGGVIQVRELNERLGLNELVDHHLSDSRQGKNIQLTLTDLLRQSIYRRLAGYEAVNDAARLSQEPTFRLIAARRTPVGRCPRSGPLFRRLRRGFRVRVAAPAVPPRLLGLALHLPAFRPGFLVAGFARLLRGPGSGTVSATVVAPLHTLRLRGRRRDASEHHDGSQDTNTPPKTHSSLHAVLLWCSVVCPARHVAIRRGSFRYALSLYLGLLTWQ
jgi:hypothetical protein